MELPAYQPRYLETPEAFRAECARLGLELPMAEASGTLDREFTLGSRRLANRFCAQPIAGQDAKQDGAPGELTRRRYQRLAEGGFGVIWWESTVAGASGPASRLRLHGGTVDAFRALVTEVRARWRETAAPLHILQLDAGAGAGWAGLADDDLVRRQEALVTTALLAAEAGFDGIDFQCSHGSLAGALLNARERPGRFGGDLVGRSRFVLESLEAIRSQAPQLLRGVRLCGYAATKGGFGAAPGDYRRMDLDEPTQLARLFQQAGVSLLNVTASSPRLRAPAAERGHQALADDAPPEEHPLMTLDRQLRLAAALRAAAPGVGVVGSGWSWLRQLMPGVAGGAVECGGMDMAGLGRAALADPLLPARRRGRQESLSPPCIVCFACSYLHRQGAPVGCVLHDPGRYGPLYRQSRQYDADQLLAGARRCHFCEDAPCVAASPTATDIPGFIRAWLEGDEVGAYEIIRARDVLPELTARLAPGWMESEGACIERTLTGVPVPIGALQYTIAWRARERGLTGVRLPATASGRRVAVVGGGPTGIAAAARLLEYGHEVRLLEKADCLGGVPARLLPLERAGEGAAEIAALLRPALESGRLEICLGAALGEALTLEALRAEHHAVLLAAGLWQERSLGASEGIVTGLALLERARRGEPLPRPQRAVLLAGGDSAMDAARLLEALGTREIFVVFGGARSELHWHLPETWFATPGVQAMMQWQPLGYVSEGSSGTVGVRLRHQLSGLEYTLPADLVIEAMGLQPAEAMRAAAAALEPGTMPGVYAAGALINGGASVGRCVVEGLAVARRIDQDLRA